MPRNSEIETRKSEIVTRNSEIETRNSCQAEKKWQTYIDPNKQYNYECQNEFMQKYLLKTRVFNHITTYDVCVFG